MSENKRLRDRERIMQGGNMAEMIKAYKTAENQSKIASDMNLAEQKKALNVDCLVMGKIGYLANKCYYYYCYYYCTKSFAPVT